jgi:hypothetical protein
MKKNPSKDAGKSPASAFHNRSRNTYFKEEILYSHSLGYLQKNPEDAVLPRQVFNLRMTGKLLRLALSDHPQCRS